MERRMEEQIAASEDRMNKRMEERMTKSEEKVTKMEERLMGRVEKLEDRIIKMDQRLGSWEEATDRQVQKLDAEIDSVRAEVQGLDGRLNREVQSEVEDQLTPVKGELKEFVEEQVGEAVDTIREPDSRGRDCGRRHGAGSRRYIDQEMTFWEDYL